MKVNKSLLAGATSALLCAGCLGLYLAQINGEVERARNEALTRYGGEQIEICVANRDIAAGEVMTDSMIDSKMWIADLLPEGAITNRVDAVGQQLGSPILKGEVVSSKRFHEASSTLDIPYGFTAVSIPVRDVQAVGGALEAGMSVDVYATGASSTTLLVREALVLETNQNKGDLVSSGSTSWITLAIAPGSVAELIAAAQNLELYLTLPNAPFDPSQSEAEDIYEDEIEDAASNPYTPSTEDPEENPGSTNTNDEPSSSLSSNPKEG